MSQNKVNMSLDEIIKENKNKGTRGRGSFRNRGGRRGRGGRGRGGGGQGGGGGGEGRSRSRSRSRSNLGVRGGGVVGRGRGRGRGGRGRGGAVGRLSRRDLSSLGGSPAQNRSRSASRNRGEANNVQRSRSRSRNRNQRGNNNANTSWRGRSQSRNRGGQNNNIQRQRSRSRSKSRGNANLNVRGGRGRGRGRGRGISKINRNKLLATGISTAALRAKKTNSISQVGLRSDQIVQAQKLNRVQNKLNNARNLNNIIKTQTFTRSRSLPRNNAAATSLTVSVANDFAGRRKLNRKRRNSVSNQVGYLNKASLEKLSQILGGNTVIPKGPGSVRSIGSNRSRRSNRSMRSNGSQKRGQRRKNFSIQKVLNPRLQQEIAQIQGRTFSNGASAFPSTSATVAGIDFVPTPHLTTTSLSDRFGKM